MPGRTESQEAGGLHSPNRWNLLGVDIETRFFHGKNMEKHGKTKIRFLLQLGSKISSNGVVPLKLEIVGMFC